MQCTLHKIGMDIGATSIKIIGKNLLDGSLLELQKYDFVKRGKAIEEFELNVMGNLTKYMEQNGLHVDNIHSIGIGLAAVFDRRTNIIVKWPNNSSWTGLNFKRLIEEKIKVPVKLEDDANAAALGEYYYGNHQNENFIYITVGTGIGGGIILDGELYRGLNGWAADFGHIPISPEGELCACGLKGCLQTIASGRAITKRLNSMAQNGEVHFDNLGTAIAYFREYNKEGLMKALDQAGFAIATAIMQINAILDINLYVVGGGVAKIGHDFISPIQKHVGMSHDNNQLNIVVKPSELVDLNGSLGTLELLEN